MDVEDPTNPLNLPEPREIPGNYKPIHKFTYIKNTFPHTTSQSAHACVEFLPLRKTDISIYYYHQSAHARVDFLPLRKSDISIYYYHRRVACKVTNFMYCYLRVRESFDNLDNL